ncbi:MAG: redoxin domain-containing protein, partial [Anaerolineales bacterium]|nr:redoxin domain-containing protein [Anaerolineales bacterium]
IGLDTLLTPLYTYHPMSIHRYRRQTASLSILLLGLVWIWISKVEDASALQDSQPAPQTGFAAPDFSLSTLEGEELSLSQFAGQPVVINYWASWCSPCKAEMPAIERAYRRRQAQGLVVLGVNATNQDSLNEVAAFTQAQKLTFPILLDTNGAVGHLYRIQALPTTFFVDRTGVIREVIIGGPMSEALLNIRIENLLESAP